MVQTCTGASGGANSRALCGLVVFALCLFSAGQVARASDAGLVEIAAAVRAAMEAEGEQRPIQARAALAAIERAPALVQQSASARYAAARLLEQLDRREDALSALPDASMRASAHLGEVVWNDVQLRRARLLTALGRCEQAQPLWAQLEGKAPDSDLRALRLACVEPTRATEAEPERVEKPLTIEQRLRRAETLTSKGRGEEAVALLDALPKHALPNSLRARFTHLRGMALFRMRTRYAEAARVLSAAATMASPTAEQDAFYAARAIARAGDNERAARAMRAFAKRYPKGRYASEALYLAGWLQLRADHPEGERALANWLSSAHAAATPSLAAEAQMLLGMRAYDRKEYAKAGQRFAAYAELSQGCLERGRGLYWAAQADRALGQADRARTRLLEATRVEPLCWYALLARGALRALDAPLPPPYGAGDALAGPAGHDSEGESAESEALGDLATADAVTNSANATTDAAVLADTAPAPSATSRTTPPATSPAHPLALPLPADAAFYAALGFDADAARVLRNHERSLLAAAPAGRGLPALVHAYHALGAHNRARALVQQAPAGLLTTTPSAANAFALRAAYARPHRALVQQLCESEQVEEDFVYAIMLKESAFEPSVVSSADAIGLMQLLPSTGRVVGRELGLTVTRNTLLQPRTNIRLGVRLLKQLLRRYDGQHALAAAAYNAGAHRVDGWLARARRAARQEAKGPKREPAPQHYPLDRFVEEIPIDQTRNYVRRVLAFFARYRYLGDDGLGRGPVLELPEHVRF